LELSLVRFSVEDSRCKKKPTNVHDDSQEKKWCVRAAACVNKVDTLLPYGHSSETMSDGVTGAENCINDVLSCSAPVFEKSPPRPFNQIVLHLLTGTSTVIK
jgi:hypothetical protein